MIEGLFNQTNYVAAKKMLDATALRHEAIASNLANLETPRYKRVDVAPSFAEELQQAVGSRDADRIAGVQPQLAVDPLAVPVRKDGNTVQIETELLKLNQNFLEHQLETQLVSGALLKLRLAITGRPF
jgi:flagellar basal-body rod protein FlgB